MAYYGEHQPIQIVESHNHKFTLQNLYSVEQILKSPELRDRNIIVVSIAGALRKGKSFLLNFFLKYLNAQVCVKQIYIYYCQVMNLKMKNPKNLN